MLLEVILLLAGFVILIKGAEFLVSGSASIAKKFNISNITIGLTVVACGTSTPEMVVSILSAIENRSDASFGNVIGSNIFNLLFILGISGLVYPLAVQRNTVRYEVPISLLAALLLYVLVNDQITSGKTWPLPYTGELSRWDSAILLLCFGLFGFYVFKNMKRSADAATGGGEIKVYKNIIALGLVFLGLGMLVGGGNLVVHQAVNIANRFGLSEKLIGLTILAAGTSLPELATSAVAAYKKQTDIAIGNVVGSNIFNILFILSITGMVHPMSFNGALNFDLQILGASTILLLVFMFTINRRKLDRWEALLMLLCYIGYTVYLITSD